MSNSKVILGNISYNFIAQIWLFILNLAVIPFFVDKLGLELYGVLAIVIVVMGYFTTLDFGLGAAVVKYVSDYYSRRDYESISKIIGSAFIGYVSLGVFGTFLIIVLARFIVLYLLHTPAKMQSITLLAFYLSSIGLLINMSLSVFSAIPNALQRMDLLAKRTILLSTGNIFLQVIFLKMGFGLNGIIIANLLFGLIGMLVFIHISKQLLPKVSFKPTLDLYFLKILFNFGKMKFVNQFTCQVVFCVDRLLIGFFLPIEWVTYYVIPLTLVQKATGFMGNISSAFFPAACEFFANKEKKMFEELYLRTIKLVIMIIFPICLFLIADSYQIFLLWMGKEFAEKSSLTLQILGISYSISIFSTIPALSADAVGKPHITAIGSTISAVINIILCILLIPIYGISGVAYASLVAAILSVPMFFYYINKKILNISFFLLIKKVLIMPLISGILFFIFLTITRSYIYNLSELILIGICGFVLYFIALYCTGIIDDVDKKRLSNFIHGAYLIKVRNSIYKRKQK